MGQASGQLWAVYGALILFGFLYNLVVSWLERRGYDEGYTALLVVAGVAVTLGGVAFIDERAAGLTLGAFACSGGWMVLGSWWRHVRARRRAQDLLQGGLR